jgi:hypothetical protein
MYHATDVVNPGAALPLENSRTALDKALSATIAPVAAPATRIILALGT